jgi:hypothetical protein
MPFSLKTGSASPLTEDEQMWRQLFFFLYFPIRGKQYKWLRLMAI